MTTRSAQRSLVGLVLLAALLATLTAAHAQFSGGGSGRGGTGGMPPGRHAGGASGEGPAKGSPGDAVAQLAADLSVLDDDLRLATAQRGAWNLYVDRLRKFADDVARNRSALRFPKEDAPRQLDLLVAAATNRLTAIEEIAEAGKALYAAMTPDQRELADRRLARIVTPLVTGDTPAAMSGEAGGGPRGPGSRGDPARRSP